jgi:hypothetical protein
MVAGGMSLMPRYFFHTLLGEELITDPEGAELADADHAWRAARGLAHELVENENAPSAISAVILVLDVVLELPVAEVFADSPARKKAH